MTALQWIVKEAKKLKKEYPKRFASWKEYVAQASAIYAKKHKGKTPVGKKKVGAVKKKTAATRKKAATSTHKDTKSHNVRISVVSGIGSLMSHYKDQYGKLASKKLLEKTKRGKSKLTKEMQDVALKIKKLKNW